MAIHQALRRVTDTRRRRRAGRLAGAGADVVGLNCCRGPATMLPLIAEIVDAVDVPVAALPVPYRTTPEQPTFQSLRDPATTATRPGSRSPPASTHSPAPATSSPTSPAAPASSAPATSASAAAPDHTTSAPLPRRSAATRRPAGTPRTCPSTPTSAPTRRCDAATRSTPPTCRDSPSQAELARRARSSAGLRPATKSCADRPAKPDRSAIGGLRRSLCPRTPRQRSVPFEA